MTTHLLAISVGPVQEFIAAARRTRDLWFGSHMLSEISRAVAKSVENPEDKLVFPASWGADNVANVILAELGTGDPNEVVAKAKEAAQNRWLKFAEEARGEASGVIHTDIWNDQVQDVLEFYAAWILRSPDYPADRTRVMRLLAGRKNCRDFRPAKGRARLPKSSLDGLRETVLVGPKADENPRTYREQWPLAIRQELRVGPSEQLDAVGLVKRAATGKRSYPSVARVAADPWLRGAREQLQPLIAACNRLPSLRRDYHIYRDFPFDGTVVYPSRHADLGAEAAIDADLSPVKDILQPVLEEFGEASPYLAVLVADGDDMGKALAKIDSVKKHQEFSAQLADFAATARTLVESADGDDANRGVLVYSGGDDVLAFLPVDKALQCARALHTEFGKRTGMTLSVGIAIAHFMEPLEDLLAHGRAAEKDAKQVPGKDALAVHLHKRGGAPIEVREPWHCNLDQQVRDSAGLIIDRAISSRVAYDLVNLAAVYRDWPTTTVKDAIQRDVRRVLSAKKPGGKIDRTADIRKHVEERVQNSESLRQFAFKLLIARQLAVSLRQAAPQKEGHQ